MRNMLAFLAAMTLAFVCTGWYLDWFSFRDSPAPATGKRSVTVDFNTKKIGEDLYKAEQKVQEKLAEKAKATSSTLSTPTELPVIKTPQDLNIPTIDFSGDN